MTKESSPPTPPGWGNDSLSEYIDVARQNVFATFHNLKHIYERLRDISGVFKELEAHLNNPKEWFAVFFVVRAECSYLSAAELALSGKAVEAFVVLRACLEAALYGLYLSRNPDKQEVWLRRGEDEKARKACRNEFTSGRLLRCLKEVDSVTHDRVKKLYDISLDFGGHPNELAITSMLESDTEDGQIHFNQLCMTDNDYRLRHALAMTARTGICVLDVFRNVFSERYEILDLPEKIDALRKDL
ncbi:MAG: hypothetical protein JW958_10390 [Candidatus Eisenbacteria bacterium]|nr:hypothetical protein [Candidatus Eisenbacteria bacterium]